MGILDKVFKKRGSGFGSELDRDLKMDDFDKELGLGPEPSMPGSMADNLGQSRGFPGESEDIGAEPSGYGHDTGFGIGPEQKPLQARAPAQQFAPQQQMPPPMHMPSPPSDRDIIMNKNMEVIASKLDALRMSIESISQRLANLEKIASDAQESQKTRYKW